MGIFDMFGRKRGGMAGYYGQDARSHAMVPKWTSPPTRNTAEWMSAYGKNPRMAVIEKISSDLSYAKGKLYKIREDGEKQEIDTHPFLDLWRHPNPLYELTASAIWKLQSNYLLLKGEGYFLIERYGNGYPAELWPVPPQWVQMTPYQGSPYYTIRTTDGGIMEVSVDDMFVMKDLNPLDPYKRGLGQAEAMADEIEIDEYAAKFQKKFFYNDGTPGLVIVMPGAEKEQGDRFLARWKERFQGVEKSHGVSVIGAPRDTTPIITKLSDNMKDMDMVNGRMFIRDAVMEHFGMPREIMGITQNSNRATADAAQYIYARNVLTPRLMDRQDAINQQLLPAYGDDLSWEFDDIIPKDKEYEKGVALDGWNAGLLTMDQALEKLGMEPAKKGDIYKMNFADLFIGAEEDRVELSSAAANLQYADTPEPIEADRNDIEVVMEDDILLEEEKALERAAQIKARRIRAAGASLAALRDAQTKKFEAAMVRYSQEQAGRLKRVLFGTEKADGTVWDALEMNQEEYDRLSEQQRDELAMRFAESLLDWKEERSLLETLLTPLWAETYDKGAQDVISTYRIPAIDRTELTSTARLRGGQRVTRVNQTTKDRIGQIVAEGLSRGKGRLKLQEEIMEEMGTSANRARTIAAQECNTSLLAGNFDMARRGGFSAKTWHITNASKARDTHKELDGKTVPITEPFVTSKGNKLMMPCDPDCNVPEETVNCHCFLTYS